MHEFIDWSLRFIAYAAIGCIGMKAFTEIFFIAAEWYVVVMERA